MAETPLSRKKVALSRMFCLAALFATIIVVMGHLSILTVEAAQVSLTWTAPSTYSDGTPITNLAGYKLYIGNASGSYQKSVDVGNQTSYTLDVPDDGTTHFLAVTAYDVAGVESNFSDEVSNSFSASSVTNHLITATSVNGGTITAINNTTINQASSGTTTVTSVTVNNGANQNFSIAANAGYHIVDVKVDGISVGPVTSYNFASVSANHTISATFALSSYTITASAGSGGSITPSGVSTLNYGASQSYSIVPANGYRIVDVKKDGVSVGAITSYLFSNIAANHTISATFAFASSNLLSNGDFESGNLKGWINGGGMTITSQASYSGKFGAKMAGSGRIDHLFNTVVGRTYYVSARIRIDQQTVSPSWGGLVVRITNFNWMQLTASPYLITANSPVGAWKQIRLSFVATTTKTRLTYQNFSNGQFTASADNFTISTMPLP